MKACKKIRRLSSFEREIHPKTNDERNKRLALLTLHVVGANTADQFIHLIKMDHNNLESEGQKGIFVVKMKNESVQKKKKAISIVRPSFPHFWFRVSSSLIAIRWFAAAVARCDTSAYYTFFNYPLTCHSMDKTQSAYYHEGKRIQPFPASFISSVQYLQGYGVIAFIVLFTDNDNHCSLSPHIPFHHSWDLYCISGSGSSMHFMWWLWRNALRHCKSHNCLYLLSTSFSQNCASRSDLTGTSSENYKKNLCRMMKKPLRRSLPFIAKYPENAIIMWIGSAPRIARKKISFTDGMEMQSLYIHFLYCIPHSKTSVEINLVRPLDELFLQTCDKIKEKIDKFIHKQTNKVICDESETSEFVFSSPDHPNLLVSTNEQVYKDENVIDICINNNVYRLLRNPPRCTKLALKLKPLVGCPLMATFSLADDSRKVELSFHWYVGESDASLISPMLNNKIPEEHIFIFAKTMNYADRQVISIVNDGILDCP
ncbi:unnamed protein product [Onchocerca flexuosa]|uniref:Ig-like domain-containing protein n=1 Tax=Onchocerca flexuosa TaxID=387005 RepID=A0A183GYE1_9BILA|nr:unnamed protein product [Onchocerca flexuosa]